MKIKSSIITEASGSVGGLTARHNRGGLYLRARVIPVDPGSFAQNAIRAIVSFLTSGWADILTPAQREAWDNYAEQVPLPDRLGEPRNVGGIAMYVRSNVPRLQVALPRVDDGPTRFNLGGFTNPDFDTLTEAGQNVSVGFDTGDNWVGEDDAAMLLFSSQPKNASVNYFKGPYRAIAPILGDSAIPPVSPVVESVAFPFVAGQRVFFRAEVTRADGRLSSDTRAFALAVA